MKKKTHTIDYTPLHFQFSLKIAKYCLHPENVVRMRFHVFFPRACFSGTEHDEGLDPKTSIQIKISPPQSHIKARGDMGRGKITLQIISEVF